MLIFVAKWIHYRDDSNITCAWVSHSWLGNKLMLFFLCKITLALFGLTAFSCLLAHLSCRMKMWIEKHHPCRCYQHARHLNRMAETMVLTSKTFKFRETIWSTFFFNLNNWCVFCFPLLYSFCDNYNEEPKCLVKYARSLGRTNSTYCRY